MKLKPLKIYGDGWLWAIYFLLIAVSVVSVYTSVGLYAVDTYNTSPLKIELKHILSVVLGTICAIAVPLFNRKLVFCASSLVFLAAMVGAYFLWFTGTGEGRWFSLGSFNIQPSELAKVTGIAVIANLIQGLKGTINPKTLINIIIVLVLVLIFPITMTNGSMGFLIFFLFAMMLWWAGLDWRHLFKVLSIILVGAALFFALKSVVSPHKEVGRSDTWSSRIESFFHPDYDAPTQENTARMAVARGGAFGVGVGNTIHGRLMKEAHNDFIFSVIIEEAGSVLALGIFLLYVLFFFRCMRLAVNSSSIYGSLCAGVFGLMIFAQALINMCVGVGAMPVTGQTLPFVSFGGTSYIILGYGLGLVQSVARDNKRRRNAEAKAEAQGDNNVETTDQQIETI